MYKCILAALCFSCFLWATEPNAVTRRWWSYTEALANDKMQGRDTGSAGYTEAEKYVIQQFQKAGLSPAGTDGFRQAVPIRSLRLQTANSPIEIVRKTEKTHLAWYRQVTVALRPNLPQQVQAPLYFIGDGASVETSEARGAVIVTMGVPRIRTAGAPVATAVPEGAVATVTIDNLGGPEPPIWPMPYAAVMSLAGTPATDHAAALSPLAFRFNPAEAETLFAGSGHSYAELKKQFDAGGKLPNFALSGTWQATLRVEASSIILTTLWQCAEDRTLPSGTSMWCFPRTWMVTA